MHDHPLARAAMPGRSFVQYVFSYACSCACLTTPTTIDIYAHAHFLKHVMRVRTYVRIRIIIRLCKMASSVFESSSLLQPLPFQETKEEAGTVRFRTS